MPGDTTLSHPSNALRLINSPPRPSSRYRPARKKIRVATPDMTQQRVGNLPIHKHVFRFSFTEPVKGKENAYSA
jgi:hypothetical protein